MDGKIDIANVHQRAGDEMDMASLADKELDNTQLLNEGALKWTGGDIDMKRQATVTVKGTVAIFDIFCDGTMSQSATADGVQPNAKLKFENGGKMRENGFSPTIKLSDMENDDGDVQLDGGPLATRTFKRLAQH
jgi:hypothetical protein